MGIYVNPGNSGFRKMIDGNKYVDKTGMISYINSVLNTIDDEICFTRPRRFGKPVPRICCVPITPADVIPENSLRI